MTRTQHTYAAIKQFLSDNANAIQQRATLHHKDFIGGERFRSEFIAKYQANHIEIVKQLAAHLEQNDIHEGLAVFKRLGETVAQDSINDDLTIEEAVDGIIFLKQALWEKTKETGLINHLTVEEFYHVSQIVGIYIDVVSSKIAFTYHNYYKQKIANELVKRQHLETQRNEFISMVGHELKTPVTSLKAFAHVLERRFAKAGDDTSALHLKRMGSR